MTEGAQTWHYGVMARWWAEFNLDGPEIDWFRPFVESGQPALDAACGTGRLLVPYLHAGLDVDGSDTSPDMLGHVRARCEREGLPLPNLYAQAMHELDLPRRYRTIVVCGGFGLGSTRGQDEQALRRLFEHLEPGGLLALDAEAAPYGGEPRPWAEEGPPAERRRGSDGAEYALRSRVAEVDPGRSVTLAMRAWMWRDGELVAEEEHLLTESFYGRAELVGLLEAAGFTDIEVRGGYHDGAPEGDEDMLVYLARRPVV
jgi:SAM-dependent methyltransferase